MTAPVARLWRLWRAYWFSPAPLIDLAATRVVLAGSQLVFLYGAGEMLDTRAAAPDELYHPLRMLQLFTLPFEWALHGVHLDASAWHVRPSALLTATVLHGAVVLGILAMVGLASNVTMLGLALSVAFLGSYVFSFGEIHHPEAVFVLALFLVGSGPCGRRLSIDALVRSRRSERRGTRDPVESPFARWPLLTARWLLALVYLSAAWAKLSASGLEWLNGYTLRWYLLRDGIRKGIEHGVAMADFHELAIALSWITVLFEATFVLAVIFPRLCWIYLPLGVALHLGIDATIGAPFYHFIALYAVFVPWSRLFERARSRRLLGALRPETRPG